MAQRSAVRARVAPAAPGAGSGGFHLRLGIGDDCAVLAPGNGEDLVVTTDLFLEQVHFRRDWHTPESAGHRCLARGLSDLAAMGARPVAALLSLALPPALARPWAHRFLKGLLALAESAGVPLAGGDTAAAPGRSRALFAADIVLLGAVRRGRAILRSGARAGDLIYVTGALGGAAAELAQAAAGRRTPRSRAAGAQPHFFPQPRLGPGRRLAGLASAAIDLSDGLSTDLAHLCEASALAATVDEARLPIHPLAAGTSKALPYALHGGEDYELLFTAPAHRRIPRTLAGVPVTPIGQMVPRRPGQARLTLQRNDGRRERLGNKGWQHRFNDTATHPQP